MLHLRGVTALGIVKWRICCDNAVIDKIFQCHSIFFLASSIQISLTPRQCAEMFVDGC